MANLSYSLVPRQEPTLVEEITFTVRGDEAEAFISMMSRIGRTPGEAKLATQFFVQLEDYRKRTK